MSHAVVAYWDTCRTKPLLILLETQLICVMIKPNDTITEQIRDERESFCPVSVYSRSLQFSTAEGVRDKNVALKTALSNNL